MPNFKEFIKGFEEKPEAKNPNPAPTQKPQEVKMEQPKPQPKEEPKPAERTFKVDISGKDMYDKGQAYYYGRTGDMVDLGGKKYRISTKDDGTGKIGYSDTIYLKDESGKLNAFPKEQFIKEAQLLKPEPKQGSFENMMQGFGQPKMATEKKAEQYHEPKPKVEMDEDYERSWGPERKKDGYYKDDKGEIYLVEQGDTYYPVNEAERTEFFNAFNKQAKEAPKAQQPKQPKQGSFEQAFGNNQPREEFSQEDKAALVATYGAFPEEGIVARKLPNGNYLTNILSGADTEPEEVDEATLSKVFDELRGEKGFEEIINEWRENPNLIRERRNVQ